MRCNAFAFLHLIKIAEKDIQNRDFEPSEKVFSDLRKKYLKMSDKLKKIKLRNIKLIIWDLDDTFWKGILCEGNVKIPLINICLLKKFVNTGIMNSICSKNDFLQVKNVLEKNNLWELFVFPEISYMPKGEAVKRIIENMQLREENTLFIDDNITNLKEVEFYNPNISVMKASYIKNMAMKSLFLNNSDKSHNRLANYKLLEKKFVDKKATNSNIEFLITSEIKVKITNECVNEIDRIYELISRTNQLNFTKKRINKNELITLLSDKDYNCGYITVWDKYGDYGVVGFFALKENKLEHFLFSCRILGMGIEQWLYYKLGFPVINITGETAVKLNTTNPIYINEVVEKREEILKPKTYSDINILIKGGCDLEYIGLFLNSFGTVDCEFNYTEKSSNYMNIQESHTEIIRGGVEYSREIKEYIYEHKPPFYGHKLFQTKIFNPNYSVVIYSVLMDYTQGIYKYNGKALDFSLCQGIFSNPILDKKHGVFKRFAINDEYRDYFLKEYTFIGAIDEKKYYDNLTFIRKRLSQNTVLILLNGSEIAFDHEEEDILYQNHKKMNEVTSRFCKNNKNTYLVDVNKYIKNQDDMLDSIRHYKKRVYFYIAKEIENIVNTHLKANVFEVANAYLDQNFKLYFTQKGNAFLYCKYGFNEPEENFTWSNGKKSILILPPPKNILYSFTQHIFKKRKIKAIFRIFALLDTRREFSEQIVLLKLNGKNISQWCIKELGEKKYELFLDKLNLKKENNLTFEYLYTVRPVDIGIGEDTRELAISFIDMNIEIQ